MTWGADIRAGAIASCPRSVIAGKVAVLLDELTEASDRIGLLEHQAARHARERVDLLAEIGRLRDRLCEEVA
jgi:hypothetical protein